MLTTLNYREKCCQLQNVKSQFIAGDAKNIISNMKLFPINHILYFHMEIEIFLAKPSSMSSTKLKKSTKNLQNNCNSITNLFNRKVSHPSTLLLT